MPLGYQLRIRSPLASIVDRNRSAKFKTTKLAQSKEDPLLNLVLSVTLADRTRRCSVLVDMQASARFQTSPVTRGEMSG